MTISYGHQFFILFLLFLLNYRMSYIFIYLLYIYKFGLFGVFTNLEATCLERGY